MNEEAFHAALRDDPSDELTWSALADWLDDDGQGDRAELLRRTRRMATIPIEERGDLPGRVDALLRAGAKPVVVQRENALGMRFSLVTPGRFLMGSPPDEQDRSADELQHEVSLTRPFWLGIFPVTQRQWQAVLGESPSYYSSSGNGWEEVFGLDTGEFPVEGVSSLEVQQFLDILNAGNSAGWEYRLPTEAQWEYACRGGPMASTLPFHFASPAAVLSPSQANFRGDTPTVEGEPVRWLRRTCAVGAHEPNVLGLYDLHGNVWEWCADSVADYPRGERVDPVGPIHGPHRAIRGGAWGSDSSECRAAYRNSVALVVRMRNLGFRIALVPTAADHSPPGAAAPVY